MIAEYIVNSNCCGNWFACGVLSHTDRALPHPTKREVCPLNCRDKNVISGLVYSITRMLRLICRVSKILIPE